MEMRAAHLEMRAAHSSNMGMTGREHIVIAACYGPIEGMEVNHATYHLLQVPTVMRNAYVIQQSIEDLDESDYRENDLPTFLILMKGSCKVVQGFLEYIKKGKSFLNGRAYCCVCGVVLLSRQDEQNLVDEQLLGALPNEPIPYYARRFKGQEDFENQIRACFHELQRIAFASRSTLVDIQIPEDVGCPPLKLRRASETGISDARVDANNSDAGGPPLTRARARRPATRSIPGDNDIQRTWRINPSRLFEIDIDDTEMEGTSATSTDSPLDLRGEMCGRCHVNWRLATGAGSSGGGSRRVNHAGVKLIIDI